MAKRNLISEYIAQHPENTVWTPEDGWFDRDHTTCGHPVPTHHETTWGTDGDVFCSLKCMADHIS